MYSKVLGVELQFFDHGAEVSGRDLAREVLDSGNAVGTDIQRAMASPTVLGNPVVAELLRACHFPRFSEELGTLREFIVVHLCTNVKNISLVSETRLKCNDGAAWTHLPCLASRPPCCKEVRTV